MFRKSIASLLGLLLLPLVFLAGAPGISGGASNLTINEILASNATINIETDFYEYASWIEIHNDGIAAEDLTGYALSYVDYKADTADVWKIPGPLSVPAGGKVLIWADGADGKGTHASFELDMRGDEIALLDPAGNVVDVVSYDMRNEGDLLPDVSYGRQTDGGENWVYFDQPTPGTANTTTGYATAERADEPLFSLPGGFYSGTQSVSLETDEDAGGIRYTTDGSTPSASSTLYTEPLAVASTTVIRARVFASGKLASKTASHTYLIDVDRHLAAVSLATDPANLFDDTIGIYVDGTNGKTGKCSEVPVNWYQGWERPASMEMIEPDGSRVVAQDIGFEIFGGCTRSMDRKSLELKPRRRYGDKDIDYAVLPDKPIDSYKRLVLRNSGNDAYRTQFRDVLQQYLVKDMMDIDYQAYRPVVVYLNGDYWGIHNLRDKADEAFVEQNYGLDGDDFDMIEKRTDVHAGNLDAWDALYSFISANDLQDPANYAYVKSQIDLEEFMNYYITEIYISNTDWPTTNIRYWRAYDNGRWRWLLYDLDFGFNPKEASTNRIAFLLTCTECHDHVLYHTLVFRKLMENPEFRDDFAQRFASHINITFDPARVNALIDGLQAGIEPEMPAHIARWEKPRTIEIWKSMIGDLREFGNVRADYVLAHLDEALGSPGTVNVTVKISGEGAVLAAGVKTPGDGYSGPYFKKIPLTLKAVPGPGWLFVRWEETGRHTPDLAFVPSRNLTRTAVFEQASEFVYLPLSAGG